MSRFVVERDVGVPMADGLELAMDVYRLDGPGPWPVLLQRVPYNKARSAIVNGSVDVRRALDRGYAVCVQDVRGRFASPGTFTPFVDEGADGADTVAWLADQPWSTGPICMIGRSYSAAVQWRAAAELARRDQTDLLGAISPGMGGWDAPRQWLVRDGVFQLGFIGWWSAAHLATADLARRPDTAPSATALARAIDELYWEMAPATSDGAPVSVAYLDEWLDIARSARNGEPAEAQSFGGVPAEVPALHTAGWFDVFVHGSIRAFQTLAAQAPDRHRLVVGPWAHGGVMNGVFAERSFGLDASGDSIDLTGIQLDWFDRWLSRGDRSDSRPTVTSFVTGLDRWVGLETWPPPPGERVQLFAGGDGRSLTTVPLAQPHTWSFIYDPADPTPTLGGCTFLPGLEVAANAGPRDQRPLLERDDAVVMMSPPLPQDLRLAGEATFTTAVGVSVRSSILVVTLSDLDDKDRAEFVAQGACRFDGAGDNPTPVTVRLAPTHHCFAAGHRVGLHVAAASYPALDRLAATAGSEAPMRVEVVATAGQPTILDIPTDSPETEEARP